MRLELDQDRLTRDLAELAELGRDPAGGMTRLALTESDARARDLVRGRMEAMGLEIFHDEVGNLIGRRRGRRHDAPSVMTGSHLDSVPRGGRFDGPLGVVGALEALRGLDDAKVETERPIDVAVFVGEEGSRFKRGTIGSCAMTGEIPVGEILALRDADGVSFAEALATYGAPYGGGSVAGGIRPAAQPKGAIHSFVELHIEQGGVLETAQVPVGAVTAIAGLIQFIVTITGDANHAGATPMNLRKDALLGAAEMIAAVERIAKAVGEGAVATVGKCEVEPGAFNIIPGRVTLAIDARAARGELLDRLDTLLRSEVATLGPRRGLGIDIVQRQRVNPGPMDELVIAAIERAAAGEKLASQRITSGAIHDALHMSFYCPSSMIFIPSIGGKSHCPEEDSSIEQMTRGCAVLARTLVELANS